MPSVPEIPASLFIGAVIGAWLMAIAGIIVMRWHYTRRLERLGEASSQELMNELESAYTAAPTVRIQTQTEYLPFIIETIRENVDAGLGENQAQLLVERIENHRLGDERQAMFPVEIRQRSSDLRLKWTCDAHHRIDIQIQGDQLVVRALRELRRKIPKAAIYGQAGRS